MGEVERCWFPSVLITLSWGWRVLRIIWCTVQLTTLNVTVNGFDRSGDGFRRVPTVRFHLYLWWAPCRITGTGGAVSWDLRYGRDGLDVFLKLFDKITCDILTIPYADRSFRSILRYGFTVRGGVRRNWARDLLSWWVTFWFLHLSPLKLIDWGSDGGKWSLRSAVTQRWLVEWFTV